MQNPFNNAQYPVANQHYYPPQQYNTGYDQYYPPQQYPGGQQYYAQPPQQYYYPPQQQQQQFYYPQYQNPFAVQQQQNVTVPNFGPNQDIIIKCSIEEMVRRFFNDYIIVWFDAGVHSLENKQYIAQLERFCEVKTFTNWEEASACVKASNTACHVITSGINGEVFTKEVFSRNNVVQIYVFCQNKEHHVTWAKPYEKISCIETNIQNVLNQIKQNLLKWYKQSSSMKINLPAFAPIFNDIDTSEMNNLHRYLKVIPNFKNRLQAKYDLLTLAKRIYTDQKNIYLIGKFEAEYNEYQKDDQKDKDGRIIKYGILRWYSEEGFVYKIVNNCLRIASADSIQYGRLLLKDIEQAIKEQYQQKSKHFNGLLYRATYLSAEEWSSLKDNLGKEVEMHGFLSASKEQKVSLSFLKEPSKMVFITILVPKGPKEEEQGFADIEEYSKYPDEKEVLFNVRSRFTVLETEEEWTKEHPCRHLVLLYGAQGFRQYTAERNPVQEVSIKDLRKILCPFCGVVASQSSNEIFFSTFRNKKHQVFTCKKCLPEFLKTSNAPLFCIPIWNNPEKPDVFSYKTQIKGCNLIYPFDKEVQLPLYGYQCENCQQRKSTYSFKCTECSVEKSKTWCENCVGNVTYCMKAGHAVVLERYPFSLWCDKMSESEASLLKVQNSILKDNQVFQQAEMYFKNNQFGKAIAYYKTFIRQMEGQDDPKITLNIAVSCMKLGFIYRQDKRDAEALEYFVSAFNIRKIHFGYNHPETAACYESIGTIFTRMGYYDRALKYIETAIKIHFLFNGDNSEVAICYRGIADLHLAQGSEIVAMEYYTKALKISEVVFGKISTEVAIVLNGMGKVYKKKKDYNKALETLETSLKMNKSINGDNHSQSALTYNDIGCVYADQGDYQKAVECFRKSIQINQALERSHHSEIAISHNSLGNAYAKLGENEKALEHHSKALEIFRTLHGEQHLKTISIRKDIQSINMLAGEGLKQSIK